LRPAAFRGHGDPRRRGGTDAPSAADFAAAAPDPFCRVEAAWLSHLEEHHPEVLAPLLGRPHPGAFSPGARVRPLGFDRYGLRLRLHHDGNHSDIRVPFTRAVGCIHELNAELAAILGAPASISTYGDHGPARPAGDTTP
jgi:hypothetical protein